jgi:hypothetical protein
MSDRDKTATEQAVKFEGRNPDGTFAVGNTPATGFHTNPERRHNGSWHKEDTPRYWLETMMKMKETDLMKIYDDESQPLFKRKLARCIKDGEWKEIREMVQEVYGKMPEMQITVEADDETKEEASKIIRGFALP